MTDALRLAVLCGFSVFGMLVSVSCVGLWLATAFGVLVFVAAFARLRRVLPETHAGAWEFAPLFAFAPLLALRITTPGADAAMYAAIARALLQHSPDLSAAYPGVRVAMYPRAFPGLVAALTPAFGMLKANLVAAVLCYVTFTFGLAYWLRGVVSRRAAIIVALLIALIGRNVPLGFFSWGGNPTILAFGMALTAVVLAMSADHLAEHIGCAVLILGGAFATHPIGAIGGAACAPLILLRPGFMHRAWRMMIFASVAPLMLAFKHFGPSISARETEWIARWQAGPAQLVHGRFGWFVLDYLEAFTRACGPVLAIVTCVCVGRVMRRRGDDQLPVIREFFLGLVWAALLMGIGPKLPVLGTFIYVDRLSPLWLVALAPVVAVAVTSLRWSPSLQLACGVTLAGIAHLNFRLGEPLIAADDTALLECVRQKLPPDAWVVASYGQGGQWLPALTGNPITQPHTHCSLFDETDALRGTIQARYQYLSRQQPQFNVPALPEFLASETLCGDEAAKLVRLLDVAPPSPGVY